MRVLVIGEGGREHALCWAFARSLLCDKIFCAPGNAGIANVAECLDVEVMDTPGILDACLQYSIDFVMVGPESPLTQGLADRLRENKIVCFGPSQAASLLEGSKSFTKDLCLQNNIPTAAYARFTDPEAAKKHVQEHGAPVVIKADGLAAGKGVTVAHTEAEAFAAIDAALSKHAFGDAGDEILVEEFLVGEEVSFFALCDGVTAVPFAAAQDHKAALDGDLGPNTGGMGAYSPPPQFDAAMQERVMRTIIQPTLDAMRARGTPFTGVLFAGLMITADGPKLIEYNVRFGDPETQAILPRLRSDLLAVVSSMAMGRSLPEPLQWYDFASLCVVMASKGYPGPHEVGSVIHGLNKALEIPDSVIFHAGTAHGKRGEILSAGGRVLGVTAWGPTIAAAQARAYEVVDRLDWPQGYCRRDIGWRAVQALSAFPSSAA